MWTWLPTAVRKNRNPVESLDLCAVKAKSRTRLNRPGSTSPWCQLHHDNHDWPAAHYFDAAGLLFRSANDVPSLYGFISAVSTVPVSALR